MRTWGLGSKSLLSSSLVTTRRAALCILIFFLREMAWGAFAYFYKLILSVACRQVRNYPWVEHLINIKYVFSDAGCGQSVWQLHKQQQFAADLFQRWEYVKCLELLLPVIIKSYYLVINLTIMCYSVITMKFMWKKNMLIRHDLRFQIMGATLHVQGNKLSMQKFRCVAGDLQRMFVWIASCAK